MSTEAAFARWAARVEAKLEQSLPVAAQSPERLHAAMRHAALGGGKRMRPLLVYAAGSLFDVDEATLDAPAAAVELIHAYSLVHDDLPAMDDDDLRRGRPTVHIAFDEATAILAGDALQTLAFDLLAYAEADVALRLEWLQVLSRASGVDGMCGGQALDLDATGAVQSLAALQRMHALKTGALIQAAVRMGAAAGGANKDELQRLDDFAAALGLAFQVRDDILDIEASSEQLGKTAGKDVAQAKSTYPALLGMHGATAKLEELASTMHAALATFGAHSNALKALGELAIKRAH
jgi:farnesyl diphosphate synthase